MIRKVIFEITYDTEDTTKRGIINVIEDINNCSVVAEIKADCLKWTIPCYLIHRKEL
jgi:hypothetical protein